MGTESAALAHSPAKHNKQPAGQTLQTPAASQSLSAHREFVPSVGVSTPKSFSVISPRAPSEKDPARGNLNRQVTDPEVSYPNRRIPLQRKLEIGSVDDPLEREADAVAEHVMHMSGEASHPKDAVSAATTLAPAPPIVHEVLRDPGKPLDSATRSFVEPRLGFDFSKVRVHVDEPAARSAAAVNSLAYTVGNHVAFGHGQYNTSTFKGRSLLVHELSHTLQQRPGLYRQPDAPKSDTPEVVVLTPSEDRSGTNPRIVAFASAARKRLSDSPGSIISVSVNWSSQTATDADWYEKRDQLLSAAKSKGETARSALIKLGIPAESVSVSTADLNQSGTSPGPDGQITLGVIPALALSPIMKVPPSTGGPPLIPSAPSPPAPGAQSPKPAPASTDLSKLTTFEISNPNFTLTIKIPLPYVPVPKSIEFKSKLLNATASIPKGAAVTFKPIRGIPGLQIGISGEITKLSNLFSPPAPVVTPSGFTEPKPGVPLKFSLAAAIDFKGFKIEAGSVLDLEKRTETTGLYITLIESSVKYQVPSSVLNDLNKAGAQLQKAVNNLMGVPDQQVSTVPVGVPPPPAPAPPGPATASTILGNISDVIDAMSSILDAMDKIDKAKKTPAQPKLRIGPQVTVPFGPTREPTISDPLGNKPSFGFGISGSF